MIHISIIESIHPQALAIIDSNPKFSYEIIENTSEKNLIDKLKNTDAIAIVTARLSSNVLKNCNKLQIVSRHGVGYDNVDLKFLNKKNIPLTITIKANALTVAEHVFAMMFYFNKNLYEFDKSVREQQWNKLKIINNKIIAINSELSKKNIFIIGFGRIGKELAKRCNAFNMDVTIFDPFIDDTIITQHKVTKINNIDEGLRKADYVSIHIPLNTQTKNLININNLNIMKSNAFIINTSRGGIINEHDLNIALNNSVISGAGLDVLLDEPPKNNNPLIKNPKVIFSPHIASHTKECWERHGKETIQNIFDFFNNTLNFKTVVNRNSIELK